MRSLIQFGLFFKKKLDLIAGSESWQKVARKLMTNIVNSLSVKMELGSPMINMYLLGNPDYYSSHEFGHCYWQAFVTNARSPWTSKTDDGNKQQDKPEKVSVLKLKQGKWAVVFSPIIDYIWQPHELEYLSLYDWIRNCV